jgi:hypothetical protein
MEGRGAHLVAIVCLAGRLRSRAGVGFRLLGAVNLKQPTAGDASWGWGSACTATYQGSEAVAVVVVAAALIQELLRQKATS